MRVTSTFEGSSLGADRFWGVAGTQELYVRLRAQCREPGQSELATRVRNPSMRHVRVEAGDAHQLVVTTPARPWPDLRRSRWAAETPSGDWRQPERGPRDRPFPTVDTARGGCPLPTRSMR